MEWRAAGLCHSDEHLVTGDLLPPPELAEKWALADLYPIVGGHEGAGIVREVGPGVMDLKVGDHVSASFIPSCGRCLSCVNGSQNLCDNGAGTLGGGMITDGTHRHHLNGSPIPLMAKVGTFSQYACVSEMSVVRVEPGVPFECVALVSCGVTTGWGSAVRRAGVVPGDIVAVVGIGGVGINAVQGARMAGARFIVAIDPVEFKRLFAFEGGLIGSG